MRKFFTMILALALGLMPINVAFANEDFSEAKEKLKEVILTSNASQCQQTLVPLADIELFEFFQFLDEHFSNKSSNSSLTNIAIIRFSDYQRKIESYVQNLAPGGGAILNPTLGTTGYETELAAFDNCKAVSDKYIELAKAALIKKLKNSTAQKKTSMFLEKYQSINSEMADMNFKVSVMYGYLKAFEQKLPGFVRQCIQ